MLLRCGEEANFINKYNSQLSKFKINLISIYLTPVCFTMVNYFHQNITYEYFYKLVPIDVDIDNLMSYTQMLLSLITSNLSSNIVNKNNSISNDYYLKVNFILLILIEYNLVFKNE